MSPGLAQAWLAAVADPRIAGALEAVYAEAAAEIEARKPVCVASGRCCHFEAYGHRLYVTGLEAAYTVSRAGRRDRAGSAPGGARGALSLPVLSAATLAGAQGAGMCPFLQGTLCTVHEIKPLACRTYYCDPTAQEWQQALTERLLGRIRGIHEEFGVEYRYGEWWGVLASFTR
ncbi:MAG: hypothetical protein WD749_00210 [Phycisphaerales bacterium]